MKLNFISCVVFLLALDPLVLCSILDMFDEFIQRIKTGFGKWTLMKKPFNFNKYPPFFKLYTHVTGAGFWRVDIVYHPFLASIETIFLSIAMCRHHLCVEIPLFTCNLSLSDTSASKTSLDTYSPHEVKPIGKLIVVTIKILRARFSEYFGRQIYAMI